MVLALLIPVTLFHPLTPSGLGMIMTFSPCYFLGALPTFLCWSPKLVSTTVNNLFFLIPQFVVQVYHPFLVKILADTVIRSRSGPKTQSIKLDYGVGSCIHLIGAFFTRGKWNFGNLGQAIAGIFTKTNLPLACHMNLLP